MNRVELNPFPLLDAQGNVRTTINIPALFFWQPDLSQDALLTENYLALTWNNLHRACSNLATNIVESGLRPTSLVTASNGGLVPAKLVQDALGRRDLKIVTIGISAYDRENKPLPEPIVTHHLPEGKDLGDNPLGLDDIYDRGRTLKLIRQELETRSPKRVSTGAVVVRDPGVSVEFKSLVIGGEWVLFPSDKQETEDNLRGAIWPEAGIPQNIQNIRMLLIQTEDFEERQRLVLELNILAGLVERPVMLAAD